jgi:hypothetical protein
MTCDQFRPRVFRPLMRTRNHASLSADQPSAQGEIGLAMPPLAGFHPSWPDLRFKPLDGATRSPEEEKFADCFAANLLMPSESVRASVNARTRNGRLPREVPSIGRLGLRHGEISIGRFAEHMGISKRDAMRYAEQARPRAWHVDCSFSAHANRLDVRRGCGHSGFASLGAERAA